MIKQTTCTSHNIAHANLTNRIETERNKLHFIEFVNKSSFTIYDFLCLWLCPSVSVSWKLLSPSVHLHSIRARATRSDIQLSIIAHYDNTHFIFLYILYFYSRSKRYSSRPIESTNEKCRQRITHKCVLFGTKFTIRYSTVQHHNTQ